MPADSKLERERERERDRERVRIPQTAFTVKKVLLTARAERMKRQGKKQPLTASFV